MRFVLSMVAAALTAPVCAVAAPIYSIGFVASNVRSGWAEQRPNYSYGDMTPHYGQEIAENSAGFTASEIIFGSLVIDTNRKPEARPNTNAYWAELSFQVGERAFTAPSLFYRHINRNPEEGGPPVWGFVFGNPSHIVDPDIDVQDLSLDNNGLMSEAEFRFTQFAMILGFTDRSVIDGVAYASNDIEVTSFEVHDPLPAVPLPATAPLILGAVGSIFAVRRWRRKA